MQRETLHQGHNLANLSNNIPNIPSPIVTYTAPERVSWSILDKTVVKCKLRDAGGIEIDGDSSLIIAGMSPSDRLPNEIDNLTYDAYENLDWGQQSSSLFQEDLKLDIVEGGVVIPEQHIIVVMLDANLEIDWNESQISFNVQRERLAYA